MYLFGMWLRGHQLSHPPSAFGIFGIFGFLPDFLFLLLVEVVLRVLTIEVVLWMLTMEVVHQHLPYRRVCYSFGRRGNSLR